MRIPSESMVAYFMPFWPFAIALIFVAVYWRRLSLRNCLIVFFTGIFLGYGVQMYVTPPVYLFIIAVAKVVIANNFDFTPDQAIGVSCGLASLVTAILLWVLVTALRTPPQVESNGT
jgi:hypothetical protein